MKRRRGRRQWPRRALFALLTPIVLFLLPATALAAVGISGTVSGPGPVDEVEVCVVEAKPSETCTFPEPSGAYKLPLDPGIYQVEFLPTYASHLVTQYYNHKAKLSEANRVAVNSSGLTEGIDASLELGGTIEGRVTETLGANGIEDVEVCALTAATALAVACAHTDSSGEYALPSIPPGSYRVGFWGEDQGLGYAPRFYDEKPSLAEATPFFVAAGASVTGVDAHLSQGASVAGAITDAVSGDPLTGISVCILRAPVGGPERCAFTGSDGKYALRGLTSGSYEIAFSPEFNEFSSGEFILPEEDGWRTQYYEGSATRGDSTPLQLTAPESRTDIDAALLASFTPPPPSPPQAAPDTAIPAPRIVPSPPERKSKKCRKGFRKVKIKGKSRCVKKAHKRHKKSPKRNPD